VAIQEAKRVLGNGITFAQDQYDALIDADSLLMVTEWPEFKFPNWNVVKKLMKKPVVFDGRNIYDASEMKQKGFTYYCVGVDTSK